MTLTSVNFQTMIYFYILTVIGTFLKMLLNIKSLFWFSIQPLTEAFIFRGIEPDITKNAHTSSCKVPVIIVRYSLKLIILNRLLKILKC